jgi:hypothetical protein
VRNVFFALCFVACAHTTRTTAVCPVAVRQGESDRVAVSPVLTQRLREIEQQVGSQGRLVGVVSHGFITHAAAVTTTLDVPANTCVSLVALGTSGVHDLDAHLYDPGGELLIEDVENDAHPTVQLCATEARRVYHHLEAFEGSGAYLVAVFHTDRQGLAQVGNAVGGRPALAAGGGGERSAIERRMNELRDGIARRGFHPVGDPTRADFPSAGTVRLPYVVTPDHCYTLAAVSDNSIRDVDLAVYDAQGELLARDERPSQDATLQLCPPIAATLSVEVRVREGNGFAVLQGFAADAASLGGANALWLGERVASAARAEPLERAVPATVRELEALGYSPTTDGLGRGTTESLLPSESREVAVRTEASKCLAIAAIAGTGIGSVRVEVFDTRGDLIARGGRGGTTSTAFVCSTAPEDLRAVVSATGGTGQVMVRTFRNNNTPAWIAGVDRVATSEAMGDAWARARVGWRADGTPEKIRIGVGSRRTQELNRAAHECVRVTASAGRGLPWISLTLRTPNGDSVATNTSEGTAVVTRCGATAEHLQAEVRTDPATQPEIDAVVSHAVRNESQENTP